eukprot:TRINITY_DN38413_c0_g1_i2.p1 TRINITY_DN38413_c0_g1~~TRINITY_DN38413_c0_g1_i2.p1  ORF type:complete len:1902 (+),score=457.72 TRINITY_DN38413_c0_g1_i2:324-6029(+)
MLGTLFGGDNGAKEASNGEQEKEECSEDDTNGISLQEFFDEAEEEKQLVVDLQRKLDRAFPKIARDAAKYLMEGREPDERQLQLSYLCAWHLHAHAAVARRKRRSLMAHERDEKRSKKSKALQGKTAFKDSMVLDSVRPVTSTQGELWMLRRFLRLQRLAHTFDCLVEWRLEVMSEAAGRRSEAAQRATLCGIARLQGAPRADPEDDEVRKDQIAVRFNGLREGRGLAATFLLWCFATTLQTGRRRRLLALSGSRGLLISFLQTLADMSKVFLHDRSSTQMRQWLNGWHELVVTSQDRQAEKDLEGKLDAAAELVAQEIIDEQGAAILRRLPLQSRPRGCGDGNVERAVIHAFIAHERRGFMAWKERVTGLLKLRDELSRGGRPRRTPAAAKTLLLPPGAKKKRGGAACVAQKHAGWPARAERKPLYVPKVGELVDFLENEQWTCGKVDEVTTAGAGTKAAVIVKISSALGARWLQLHKVRSLSDEAAEQDGSVADEKAGSEKQDDARCTVGASRDDLSGAYRSACARGLVQDYIPPGSSADGAAGVSLDLGEKVQLWSYAMQVWVTGRVDKVALQDCQDSDGKVYPAGSVRVRMRDEPDAAVRHIHRWLQPQEVAGIRFQPKQPSWVTQLRNDLGMSGLFVEGKGAAWPGLGGASKVDEDVKWILPVDPKAAPSRTRVSGRPTIRVAIAAASGLRRPIHTLAAGPSETPKEHQYYCTCTVEGRPYATIQTAVRSTSGEPIFDEEELLSDVPLSDDMTFSLFKKKDGGGSESLGAAPVSLQHLWPAGFEGDLSLKCISSGRPMGRLAVSLTVMQVPTLEATEETMLCGDSAAEIQQSAVQPMNGVRCFVKVNSAENLPDVSHWPQDGRIETLMATGYVTPSPYCMVYLRGNRASFFRSKVVPATYQPTWHEEGEIGKCELTDSLVIDVVDSLSGGLVGRAELAADSFLDNGFSGSVPLHGPTTSAGTSLSLSVFVEHPEGMRLKRGWPAPDVIRQWRRPRAMVSIVSADMLALVEKLNVRNRSMGVRLERLYCVYGIPGRPWQDKTTVPVRRTNKPVWQHADVIQCIGEHDEMRFQIVHRGAGAVEVCLAQASVSCSEVLAVAAARSAPACEDAVDESKHEDVSGELDADAHAAPQQTEADQTTQKQDDDSSGRHQAGNPHRRDVTDDRLQSLLPDAGQKGGTPPQDQPSPGDSARKKLDDAGSGASHAGSPHREEVADDALHSLLPVLLQKDGTQQDQPGDQTREKQGEHGSGPDHADGLQRQDATDDALQSLLPDAVKQKGGSQQPDQQPGDQTRKKQDDHSSGPDDTGRQEVAADALQRLLPDAVQKSGGSQKDQPGDEAAERDGEQSESDQDDEASSDDGTAASTAEENAPGAQMATSQQTGTPGHSGSEHTGPQIEQGGHDDELQGEHGKAGHASTASGNHDSGVVKPQPLDSKRAGSQETSTKRQSAGELLFEQPTRGQRTDDRCRGSHISNISQARSERSTASKLPEQPTRAHRASVGSVIVEQRVCDGNRPHRDGRQGGDFRHEDGSGWEKDGTDIQTSEISKKLKLYGVEGVHVDTLSVKIRVDWPEDLDASDAKPVLFVRVHSVDGLRLTKSSIDGIFCRCWCDGAPQLSMSTSVVTPFSRVSWEEEDGIVDFRPGADLRLAVLGWRTGKKPSTLASGALSADAFKEAMYEGRPDNTLGFGGTVYLSGQHDSVVALRLSVLAIMQKPMQASEDELAAAAALAAAEEAEEGPFDVARTIDPAAVKDMVITALDQLLAPVVDAAPTPLAVAAPEESAPAAEGEGMGLGGLAGAAQPLQGWQGTGSTHLPSTPEPPLASSTLTATGAATGSSCDAGLAGSDFSAMGKEIPRDPPVEEDPERMVDTSAAEAVPSQSCSAAIGGVAEATALAAAAG